MKDVAHVQLQPNFVSVLYRRYRLVKRDAGSVTGMLATTVP